MSYFGCTTAFTHTPFRHRRWLGKLLWSAAYHGGVVERIYTVGVWSRVTYLYTYFDSEERRDAFSARTMRSCSEGGKKDD